MVVTAEILEARDVEAARTVASVLVLTDEGMVASVAPRLVEARSVWALTAEVSAVIAEASELEADVTFAAVAIEPELRVASVKFLVP